MQCLLNMTTAQLTKEKRHCPRCGKGVWMTKRGWELWAWSTHPCIKDMTMTPEEVSDMIATLEQENRQLRARNERLQQAIDKINEIIEANK